MLAWLSSEDACDLLRVDAGNAGIVGQIADSLPRIIEVRTGYPASCTEGAGCDEAVRQLARFMLQLHYNPDGTDAVQLTRAVDSLTASVKALVVAEGAA